MTCRVFWKVAGLPRETSRLSPILRSRIGKSCRISSTSYTPLPPGPAPPAHGRADLRLPERHVDVVALHLYLVLGNGFDRGEGERLAGGHIELRTVAGAVDLGADQL